MPTHKLGLTHTAFLVLGILLATFANSFYCALLTGSNAKALEATRLEATRLEATQKHWKQRALPTAQKVLSYFNETRHDIAYEVARLAQGLAAPTEGHQLALRRVMAYLSGGGQVKMKGQ